MTLELKTLDRQELDVVNQTRSNLFGWRGQFTPQSKPLEFDRFGNYGEFATIRSPAGRRANFGFNSLEFDGIRNERKP